MSRFGELLGGNKAAPDPAPAPEPVVEEVVEAPAAAEEEVVKLLPYESEVNLHEMTKDELEEYGRTVGIELDKRHSRRRIAQELEEILPDSVITDKDKGNKEVNSDAILWHLVNAVKELSTKVNELESKLN